MASTIFGASLYQSPNMEENIRYDVLGADSEAFKNGDIVTVDTGVVSLVDAATEKIYGVIQGAQTMPSTNDTVYPGVTPAGENYIFLMGCNAALTDNETDYGKFFGITGASGAQQIDVVSGVTTTTSRQVVIIKVDPNNVGGTEGPQEALVKFVDTTDSTTPN